MAFTFCSACPIGNNRGDNREHWPWRVYFLVLGARPPQRALPKAQPRDAPVSAREILGQPPGCGGRPAGRLLKFSYETRQDDDKPRYSQDSSKCVDAVEGFEIAPDAEAHKEHRVGNPIGD